MKKFFVYFILSVLLIVPITSIIVITITNQPVNDFISYEAIYDYSQIETNEVTIKDLNEVINCKGKFNSTQLDYIITKHRYNDLLIFVKEIGDYVYIGDIIFTKNGKEVNSDLEGKIINIKDTGTIIVYTIKGPIVDIMEVEIPVEFYLYAENSLAVFDNAQQKYTAEFINKIPSADETNNTFIATYSVPSEGFLLDAMIDIRLATGNLRKDVYVAPKSCIYTDELGKYYLETLNDDSKDIVYVKIGLMNENEVEIIPEDEKAERIICDGLQITINKKEVFSTDSVAGNKDE